jgi:hypothetical protein
MARKQQSISPTSAAAPSSIAELPPSSFISPAAAEIQRNAIRRPLVSVWGAALLLNQNEDQVVARIEDGSLLYVFDINLGAPRKRCLRILTACVFDLIAGLKSDARSLAAVIGSILPVRPSLRVGEIAFLFHASAWHIVNLCRAGLVRRKGAESRSMRVDRASLASFLTARRVL